MIETYASVSDSPRKAGPHCDKILAPEQIHGDPRQNLGPTEPDISADHWELMPAQATMVLNPAVPHLDLAAATISAIRGC